MRYTRWAQRAAVYVVGCCILYAAGLKIFTSITTLHHYHFDIDPLFSWAACQKIQNVCLQTQGCTVKHCYACLDALREEMPSIASCHVTLVLPHRALVTIKAHKPFFVVNDHVCVADPGYAFERQQLSQAAFQSLPSITVHDYTSDDSSLNRMLCQWMHQIAPTVHTAYRIVWHDQTHICLHPFDVVQCLIVCNYQVPPTEQLLASCALAYQQHLASLTKRTCGWTADIRFAHQIILKREHASCNSDQTVRVSQKVKGELKL